MITTTIKLTVTGQNYEDIILQAKKGIADFLDVDVEDVDSKVQVELIVSDVNDSFDIDQDPYVAEVIAKIKSR